MALSFIAAGLLLAGSTVSAAVTPKATSCNGYPEFCSRLYSNVTLIGTHDSAFVGILPTENQLVSVADQLSDGIRFLQAQTHNSSGTIELCHTTCLELDAGPLLTYLETVKSFLDDNPNEVVTFLVTNQDAIPVAQYGEVMVASGLASYAYTPSSQLAIDEWPTYQELIDAGTRLVMFMDYHADTSVVPYILDEFSYFFETAYDVTSFTTCALDRPPGSSGAGLMYIVNHFKDLDILGIDIPDVFDDATTNAATGSGSIGAQVDLCWAEWDRTPNFILVDNFNIGDVFTAQDNLNNLSYVKPRGVRSGSVPRFYVSWSWVLMFFVFGMCFTD